MDNEVRSTGCRPVMKTIIQRVFLCVLVALLTLSFYDPGLWNRSISDTLIASWVMMGIVATVIFVDLWESTMLLKSAKEVYRTELFLYKVIPTTVYELIVMAILGADQALHGANICRNVVIVCLMIFIVF